MGALILLVAFSLAIALGFLFAFLWAVRSGQFDDPVTPALRVLSEDAGEFKQSDTKTTEKQTNE